MAGLRRAVTFHEAADRLPPEIVASWLNSRAANQRAKQSLIRFLKYILEAYQDRHETLIGSRRTVQYLERSCAEMSSAATEFHLPSLLLRCLSWMFGGLLALETKFLRACARLLNTWAVPDGMAQRWSHPLFAKIMTVPHAIILMPIWRLTFDVAGDAIELFAGQKPLHLAKLVHLLVQMSEEISLDYYFAGNLDRLFAGVVVPGRRKQMLCKRWLETTLNNCELEEALVGIAPDLNDIIWGGYV